MGISSAHRQHKRLNNRAGNAHRSPRVRVKVMRRFKSARHRLQLASIHHQVVNLFMHCLCHTDARRKRALRPLAFGA
jgi:putative transposase